MNQITFRHGIISEPYELQANAQGYTFGNDEHWIQVIGDGVTSAHFRECITDKEYDKILRRFQTKVLMKYIRPLRGDV